jgi:hypothetical protein
VSAWRRTLIFGACFPGTEGAWAVTGLVCAVSRFVGHRDPGLLVRELRCPGRPRRRGVAGLGVCLFAVDIPVLGVSRCLSLAVAEDGVGRWLVSEGAW